MTDRSCGSDPRPSRPDELAVGPTSGASAKRPWPLGHLVGGARAEAESFGRREVAMVTSGTRRRRSWAMCSAAVLALAFAPSTSDADHVVGAPAEGIAATNFEVLGHRD